MSYVLLPAVSTATLKLFSCEDFTAGGGPIVLTDDMSVECGTVKHAMYTAFGLAMMLSPIGGAIGTPASYLLVLWWHKDRVSNPPGPDPASRLQNRAADRVLAPFKFLFAAYRSPFFQFLMCCLLYCDSSNPNTSHKLAGLSGGGTR